MVGLPAGATAQERAPSTPEAAEVEAPPVAPPPESDDAPLPPAPDGDTEPAARGASPYAAPVVGTSSVLVDVVHRDGAVEVRARPREGVGEGPRCTTPCRLALGPGLVDFDLAGPGARPRLADDSPIRVAPGRRLILSAHFVDREGERIAGWTLFTIALTGFASTFLPLAIDGAGGADDIFPLLIGIPVAAPLLAIALPLMFLQDRAAVELFRPSFADR